MKLQKITLSLLILLVVATSTWAQTNLLDTDYYSFEGDQKWFVQHRDFWSVSDEKSATGERSLKFSCEDFSKATGNSVSVQGVSGKPSPEFIQVKLKPGKYNMTLKVWLEEKAPVGFGTNLAKPFTPIKWSFKGLEKSKWVTLSQEIEIKENTATKMVITVSSNPKWGGAGTFYVDDIALSKVQ
ncbi:hypothetical protein N7E81_18640 [Reichenbachiella carrageenanivorans]|uniref:Carbohydrate binding domain-containing protein n=1 Tax=Reichenbachiella carrageenanivorans TaxID=2979869 RepID=A0ABY6CZV1_9BACT|nr:hypothetical protein [Reichenbachiella carrageenanivorans]UXX79373.1 hypothetical protein N7E81_18640 [Reichenbachiella carrageenanivorans]